jgi:hypothetical protein
MTDAVAPEPRRLIIDYEKIVSVFVFIFVSLTNVGMIDPSPYDFASLVAMPLWFFGGFSVHRSFIALGSLLIFYLFAGFLALIPYWDKPDSALYHYQTAYLVLTAMFFALYAGNHTVKRVELCLMAFTTSSLIATTAGTLGFFNVAGLGSIFSYAGRASGTLKDPNVMGPAVILALLYLVQSLVLGRARFALITALGAMTVFSGMFLTLSRGAFGAAVLSFLLMMTSIFVMTKDGHMRRRIVIAAVATLLLVIAVIFIVLSFPEAREAFTDRTSSVMKDYDEGPTGRFGNQLRSIPMLLDRLGGFGPLRFRLIFDLDPHNSYVGAFANYGWVGGLLFILLVATTSFVALRQLFTDAPTLRQSQLFAPVMLTTFLQGFQIDVDHWRHAFFLIGMVWGLEAGREKWLESPDRRVAPAGSIAAGV